MNLLPLDEFRRIIKYPPYQFWGLDNEDVALGSACNGVVYEHAFLSADVGGRQDIREAIDIAEQKLRAFLGYPVSPKYIEETVTYPSYLDQRLWRQSPVDSTGGWVSVFTPDQLLQAIGIESLTLIGTANVTYSDLFGTGVNDTFTVSIATTETDPAKIAVYFATVDRFDNVEVGERWRVEPLNVSISGGTATITGRAWLLVKPILYQPVKRQNALNPDTSANFVTTLSIYIRTTDPNGTTWETSQGAFVWDSSPGGWWGICCGDGSTDPAAVARSIARVGMKDAAKGIVIPGEAIYNSTTGVWTQAAPPWGSLCRPPQDVVIRYLAGKSLEDGKMDARLANAVAFLAAADLPERICACDNSNRTLYRYQLPMNQTGTQQETFAVTREQLNNPLGNRYGHWLAWNEIKNLRQPRGAS